MKPGMIYFPFMSIFLQYPSSFAFLLGPIQWILEPFNTSVPSWITCLPCIVIIVACVSAIQPEGSALLTICLILWTVGFRASFFFFFAFFVFFDFLVGLTGREVGLLLAEGVCWVEGAFFGVEESCVLGRCLV